MNKEGTHIRISSDVITRRLKNLEPSRFASELNAMTKDIVFKYGEIV
jgi:hypothetical protein